MKTVAFWITPSGEITLVGVSHISEIIARPERFGFTRDEIVSCYSRHGERLGLEGRAREELLRTVLAQGFIRIRKYGNRGYSVTVHRLTDTTKAFIRGWAEQVLSGEIGDKDDLYAVVTIVSLVESQHFKTGFQMVVS